MKFRGLPRERNAGTGADVEIEDLSEGHDGAVVDQPRVLKLRLQFLHCIPLRLGGDGSEESQAVLPQKIDGALGKGVPLVHPEIPADVGMDVFCVKSYGIQNSDGLG